MKKKLFKSYNLYFLSLIGFLTVATSTFTIFVDPYGLFHNKRIEKINKWKIFAGNTSFTTKPLKLILLKPKNIIIGSSTAEAGLDPSYPKWNNGKGYNFSISGGSLIETESALKFALKYRIKEAIIVTDFERFLTLKDLNRLNIKEINRNLIDHFGNSKFLINWLNVILSPKVIKHSIVTVARQNISPEITKLNHSLENNGVKNTKYMLNLVSKIGYEEKFKNVLNYYLENFFLKGCYSNINTNFESFSGFKHFSNILEIAYSNDIDLKIVIPPIHSIFHIALIRSDQYLLYEKWKLFIKKENALLSKRFKKNPFHIYDFGIINKLTSEEIPIDNTSLKMKWFTDPVHFTKDYGDKMLDFIFTNISKDLLPIGYRLDLDSTEENFRNNKIKLDSLISNQEKFKNIKSYLAIKKELCKDK